MLAAAFRREDALRADLQQYYGIDLDRAMAGAHTARHVGALVAQLPDTARLARAEGEDEVWTFDRILAASTLNAIHTWMWAQGDKRRRGPRPRPLGPSWMQPRRTMPARVLSVDDLMRELSLPREAEQTIPGEG